MIFDDKLTRRNLSTTFREFNNKHHAHWNLCNLQTTEIKNQKPVLHNHLIYYQLKPDKRTYML